jgi:hypothetical protein
VVRARDQAADFGFRGKDEWKHAVEVLGPLVASSDAPLEDLLRMACAQLAVAESDPVGRARPYLERAERLAPHDPVLLWCRREVATIELDFERALALLREISAQRPDDFTVTLALAQLLVQLEGPGQLEEAETLYRKLLGLRPEITGLWRATIVYQLGQLLNRTGREKEAEPLVAEKQRFEDRGIKPPPHPDHWPGTLGAIPPHTPGALARPAPAPFTARFVAEDLGHPGLRGLRAYTLQTLPLAALGPRAEEVYRSALAPTLVGFGAEGVELLAGPDAPKKLLERPTLDVAPFDRMNHGADKNQDPPKDRKKGDRELDLLALVEENGGAALYLLENVGGAWSLRPDALAAFPSALGASSLLPVDFDHDGDVDLVVATRAGLYLLRNDGLEDAEHPGRFTDATEVAHLPAGPGRHQRGRRRRSGRRLPAPAPRRRTAALASNERGGVFVDASASSRRARRALDRAGRLRRRRTRRLAAFGQDLALYTQHGGGGWSAEVKRLPLGEPPTGSRARSTSTSTAPATSSGRGHAPRGRTARAGLSGGRPARRPRRSLRRAARGGGRARSRRPRRRLRPRLRAPRRARRRRVPCRGRRQGLALALLGYKDNARGVGGIVELRAERLYERVYMRGRPELLGLGGEAARDGPRHLAERRRAGRLGPRTGASSSCSRSGRASPARARSSTRGTARRTSSSATCSASRRSDCRWRRACPARRRRWSRPTTTSTCW